MQTLSLLGGNKALAYGAAAVALIVAALLILFLFRLAFGRRLRMSGGRGRQMRLGIVDAFDLDRQRQLVIVRRDNTEHLIMIGGPNDVLVESQIVRAEPREGRPRDKDHRDHREKDLIEPPQLVAAAPRKPAGAEPQLPLPPFVPDVPAADETSPPHERAGTAPASASRPGQPPLRARPSPSPATPSPATSTPATPSPVSQATPSLPSTGERAETTAAKLGARILPAATQGFMRWRPGQGAAPGRASDPTFAPPMRTEPESNEAPGPEPTVTPTPTPPPVVSQPATTTNRNAEPRPKPRPAAQPAREDPEPKAAEAPATPAPRAPAAKPPQPAKPTAPLSAPLPAPLPPLVQPAPQSTAPAPNKSNATKPDADSAPQPAAEDLMLSLEEEMAKLLGRTPDK